MPVDGAEQAVAYVDAQFAATGMVPTQKKLLFERFFDESGGMQLVVHAPFGTRINRAWGLALRKRFCRTLRFRAAGLGRRQRHRAVARRPAQLSARADVRLVPSQLARDVLVQAFLAVPFFGTRWRWNVDAGLAAAAQLRTANACRRTCSACVPTTCSPPCFPPRPRARKTSSATSQIPDHPLVRQTVRRLPARSRPTSTACSTCCATSRPGAIELIGLDSASRRRSLIELLNANPYAFLDDAPLEERRARAVTMRRSLSVEALRDLGRLDPEAIAQVTREAWPLVRDADELHDVLLSHRRVAASRDGARMARRFSTSLRSTGRADRRSNGRPCSGSRRNAGRWSAPSGPTRGARPDVTVPARRAHRSGRAKKRSPTWFAAASSASGRPRSPRSRASLALRPSDVEIATARSGEPGRGLARPLHRRRADLEWCDRRLLARIHRLTLEGLRRQIAPVSPSSSCASWLAINTLQPQTKLRGQAGLLALIEQLEGFEAAGRTLGEVPAARAAGSVRPRLARHSDVLRARRSGAGCGRSPSRDAERRDGAADQSR